MATFVLVPGAWQGGWCWKRVATRLHQAGHDVFTPTLTGLGERAHLLDEKVNLHTHIEDVLGVLRCEELSEVVLCGHSYGGMVVTGVADRAPEQIASLVYLDALLPEDGQSVLDVLPAAAATGFREYARTEGAGLRVAPGPAAAFGVNARDQAWVDRRNTDQPFKSFEQAIRLSGQWQQVPRHSYIYATGWDGVGKPFYDKVRREAGWEASTIACGHYVMIDEPQALTQRLIASA